MSGANALLLLADGSSFEGFGIGPEGVATGEAVFFTGVTGYEEALTDPSYAGQIITFCYPLIGNYGIDPMVRQHGSICCAGAVFKRVSRHPSHHRSSGRLDEWMHASGVRGIEGVDTRTLVIRLREAGTMRSVLAVGDAAISRAPGALQEYLSVPLATPDLVRAVESGDSLNRAGGKPRVALLDCGAKENIADCLAAAGAEVVEAPFDASFEDLLALKPDGLVVSNGPGDPSELTGVVDTLRRVIDHGKLPTFGICLGHQVLALALGARTFKLKYGHRGGNQPVQDLATKDVIITAQNHGYAVDPASLPADVEQTMINLNDGTNEGLRHRTLPVSSVQFHPEASPGPTDARHLFADFVAELRR
ncbi:MAG TPA: glutamine-hydrolyzing carbamoyl-phosphate synthase small subunit [Candidatus Binatus sp.]|nr:glutamine-hydrolyzing carbamoyl-phosphate synthase small subunit [Candidatus Binatus sp.]